MSKIINNKTEFILTYASTFKENLTITKVSEYIDTFCKKKGCEYFYCVSKEGPDDEVKREHFHVYCNFKQRVNVKNSTLDIKLDKPVMAFYNKKLTDPTYEVIDYEFYDENLNINNCINKYNAKDFKAINFAHPNVKFRKHYGSSYHMLNYVVKKPLSTISSEPYEGILEEYKNQLTITKRKIHKKKINEPNWEDFKKRNLTLVQVKQELRDKYSEYTIKNWFKISPGLHMIFGHKKKKPPVNRDLTYFIPREVITYLKDVVSPYIKNRNNPKWLENHRYDRPMSLCWIGPSKIGKTTFLKNVVESNYYQTLFDGFEDFDCNAPCVILDDFAKKIKDFLPSWKCWLGCQTDFTVNPKYGRRERLDWGHPCIFLSNFEDIFTIHNGFEENELDYIKKNVITVITTDDRKLWEKPKGNFLNKFQFLSNNDLVEINVGELRKIIGSDPCSEQTNIEINSNEPNSERSCDEILNQCTCGDCSLCWERLENNRSYIFVDETNNLKEFYDNISEISDSSSSDGRPKHQREDEYYQEFNKRRRNSN